MSEDIAIRVEGLGKKYRIRHRGIERHGTLRDAIVRAARRPLRSLAGAASEEDFWALKDVSFEVKRGDVLGIIGRNGAGKSTLLKILSRITECTEGRALIDGRVASLLEVGTGFHPELTGRENIYLNGAILGMSRAEVARKFDEIVAFADVEQFLDTPVKHFSSGMYVRLAFAVAAHLDQDIMLVDEVLAVGDAAFQKKCLGKMEDISRSQGRTVFFVSHNVTAISTLCRRGICLASGRVVGEGPIDEVVAAYLASSTTLQREARATGSTILRSARLVRQVDSMRDHDAGTSLTIEFELEPAGEEVGVDLLIRPASGGSYSLYCGSAYFSNLVIDRAMTVACEIGPVNFTLGSYEIDVRICLPMKKWIEEHDALLGFEIERQCAARRGFQLAGSRHLGNAVPPQHWSRK